MAKSRIKGITIELDGNTTGLQESLSDVNKKSIDLQGELRDVEKLLKFDPGNVEALAQKQQLLTKQIENTEEKLQRLKEAQSQVDQQFASGNIGEQQYRAFRREIEYTERNLSNLQNALQNIDSGSDVNGIRQDMQQLEQASDEASAGVEGLGKELLGLAAGAAVVGTLGEAVEQSLDTSSLNTKIDISMQVSEESKQAVKEASNIVQSFGVDSETALEGIRKQWALNSDASDESNTRVVEGAATIVAAYADVDFTELIQESNELSKTLGISDEEALGLMNTLLKTGFPPDQLDIISEYGSQLDMVGFSAEEIQAIFAAGIDTGTWNIDNLLDGVKEGRIKLAEFGAGVDDTTSKLLKGTGISTQKLQEWGQAVAKGGKGGTQAMQEVARALEGVEDETTRNALGVAIFGTKWEDQGSNITDTILGMNDNLTSSKDNIDGLNSSVETLNSDSAVALSKAISAIKVALEPVMLAIANVVLKIAEWVQANPTLSAAILAIISVIAVLIGIAATLAPIFSAIALATSGVTIGISAMVLPFLAVVAVIAAVITTGVLLYKNWDTIKAKATELKNIVVNKFNELKDMAINKFNELKNKALQTWENIKISVVNKINSLKEGAISKVNSLKEDFVNGFNNMKSRVTQTVQNIKDNIINKLKSINLLSIGKNIVQGLINGIKSKISAVANACKDIASTVTNKVKGLLGIHSPSRVMMELGEYTGEGLVRGLDNKIRDISNKSVDMANSISDNFNTSRSTSRKASNIDYSRLANLMCNSFKEAIISTGMDNMEISLNATKVGEALAPINDKISGQSMLLRERGVNV